MKENPNRSLIPASILFLLTLAALILFIPGCAFSNTERAEEDTCPEISVEITECLCETAKPEKTNTVEVIATNTPTPVEPLQTVTPVEIFEKNGEISDSFMNGKIVFQWVSRYHAQDYYTKRLLLIDEENIIHFLGDFTGSPAISPDGNSLAIGCPPSDIGSDVTEICILNIEARMDKMRQIPPEDYDFADSTNNDLSLLDESITKRLILPEQCWQYQYDYIESRHEGILSLSWSPGADRLALVCGDEYDSSEVCILSLDGKSRCWDETAAKGIKRVAWSPTDENTLAISGNISRSADIYLSNPDGTNKRFLAAGWSPEWSPDGSKIAYIERNPEIVWEIEGIAIINPDGSGRELLYDNDFDADLPEAYINLRSNGVYDQMEANRLAWSPDGRCLAFTAHDYRLISRLFRLDIERGEFIFLTDPSIFNFWVTEVDWGP